MVGGGAIGLGVALDEIGREHGTLLLEEADYVKVRWSSGLSV